MSFISKIIQWFEPNRQSELERYIQARAPQHAGDLDKLINEFSYKKQGGWIWYATSSKLYQNINLVEQSYTWNI